MKRLTNNDYAVLALFVGLIITLTAPNVMAGVQSLGDTASHWGDESKSIGKVLPLVFGLIGIVMAGSGVLKIAEAKKMHQPIGAGLWMLGIGAMLCSITTIIGMTSATMTGSDAASSGLSSLGL